MVRNQMIVTSAPDISEARQKLADQNFDKAKDICNKILSVEPANVNALDILAVSFVKTGQIDLAINTLKRMCHLVPRQPGPYRRLSRLYSRSGAWLNSVIYLSKAILNTPDHTRLHNELSQLLNKNGFQDLSDLKTFISLKLSNPGIKSQEFFDPWITLLSLNSNIQHLLELAQDTRLNATLPKFTQREIKIPLNDKFLLIGLKSLILTDINFERLLKLLRRHFLFSDECTSEAFLPFLCSLAEQCSLNEYVYTCTNEELVKVEEYETSLYLSGEPDIETIRKIALIGCYKRLVGLKDSKRINAAASKSSCQAFKDMVHVQIGQPMAVMKHYSSIPTLVTINDTVSKSVAEQYEENPYPRWHSIYKPEISETLGLVSAGKTILVAGCGTGQELINNALHYPGAQILGIDLSIPSLSYGKQKALELGVDNVEFMRADILDLDQLNRQFDMITCTGVLHHMQNPITGWQKLVTCLKPEGVMRIALYSENARQAVVACRKWIEQHQIEATQTGIRHFRQNIMDMEENNPLREIMLPMDFYSISMCRDLVFHVQEHRFTIPQIQNALDELELEFISMIIWRPVMKSMYLFMFPDDPEAANLNYLHSFETKVLNAFKGMYVFWCNKNGDELPDWIRN